MNVYSLRVPNVHTDQGHQQLATPRASSLHLQPQRTLAVVFQQACDDDPSTMMIVDVLSYIWHTVYLEVTIWHRLHDLAKLCTLLWCTPAQSLGAAPGYMKELVDVRVQCQPTVFNQNSATVALMFLAAKQSLSCQLGRAKAPN